MEDILEVGVVEVETTSSEISASTEVTVQDSEELEVYIESREYKVLGDDVYIPVTMDEAPSWLQNTINSLTNVSLADTLSDLEGMYLNLQNAIDQIQVAKNAYTMNVISDATLTERLNAVVQTLNSSMEHSDASIRDLIATKVSDTQASAIALNAITSELKNTTNNLSLGSTIATLKQTITDLNKTMNTNLTVLESHIKGSVDAQTIAVDKLYTYVGVDGNGDALGTGFISRLEILEKQSDGTVETYSGTYDVVTYNTIDGVIDQDSISLVTTAEPYASWLASETPGSINKRLAHIGDTFIKYQVNENGLKEAIGTFKFIKTNEDTTTPFGTDEDGFTWAKLVDTISDGALAAALAAVDTANGKASVYTGTVPNTPYRVNDLWMMPYISNGVTYTKAMVCIQSSNTYSLSHWTKAGTDITDFITNTYENKISSLSNQIDSKIEYYFRLKSEGFPNFATLTNTQRQARDGDIVNFTDTNEKFYYKYTTNTWNTLQDADALKAIDDLGKLTTTVNTKTTVYSVGYKATRPSSAFKGTYCFDYTDSQLYLMQTDMGATWTKLTGTTDPKLVKGDLLYITGSDKNENNTVYKYVGGIWENATDGKVTAVATKLTQLEASVSKDIGNVVKANSELVNTVSGVVDKTSDINLSSRFAYGSNLQFNGLTVKAGFGIATSLTVGSGITGTNSEFWVDAQKFQVRDSNTGIKPFTISNGEIFFNGKITAGNISGLPTYATLADMSNTIKNMFSATGSVGAELNTLLNQAISTKTDTTLTTADNNALAKVNQAAQAMGYTSYTDLVNKVAAGQTIIQNGYIRADLINANVLTVGSVLSGNGFIVTKDQLKLMVSNVPRVTIGLLS